MSGFDEVLGTKIEVRKRTLGNSIDSKDLSDASLEQDLLFPEFSKLLEDAVPGDDESEGCPLPGTPEDESLIDSKEDEELRHRVVNRESHDDDLVLSSMAQSAFETAEELVHKVWEEVSSWKTQPFSKLPKWLQDNDYLHHWHRPPLPSFAACFKSIFRIHTETGNIWTHLLGCISFIGVMVYFLTGSSLGQHWVQVDLKEKLVFTAFFIGAIFCLGLSFTFHTVSCHSEFVGKLFSKLDYCGIALLIMGSFVPWLYYGFYCDFQPKLIYLTAVVLLGITTIVVSLWEKFSTPTFRPLRAAVFLTFGLSGIIPAVHYTLIEGFDYAITRASMGWLILMGALYVIGALLYAVRVPERFFPGKCDLWRAWWRLTVALVVAAAYLGVTPAVAQRQSSSRLAQIMQSMVASVGSVASRIGNGMIKSVGGNNRPPLFREAPQPLASPPQLARPQRQRNVLPFETDPLVQENQAPNAPKPLRQRVEKPAGGGGRRRGVSFRQFVDTTIAGIANFIPRIRRRVQNRRRHVRELELQ